MISKGRVIGTSLALLALAACGGGGGGGTGSAPSGGTVPNEPEKCEDCFLAAEIESYHYEPYRPLMARVCDRGPLYVTGSENVSWEALCAAGDMLATMLAYRPDVALELQRQGAVTTVFTVAETVCGTDYFSDLGGRAICHEAKGGLGGTLGRPATGCSEANILSSPLDAFQRGTARGENVCVHELAHTIMNVGLTDADRERIKSRYDYVIENTDLWIRADGTSTFARQNDHEFFAELTQVYFNANPREDHFVHIAVNGASALLNYDPESFVLIDEIYVQPASLR